MLHCAFSLSLLLLLHLLRFVSTEAQRQSQQQQQSTPPPLKYTRLDTLLYFMTTPEDFERDPDSFFMTTKMHEPTTVQNFYRTAAQTYTDLKKIWRELSQDREKATKLLAVNAKLLEISFAAPLTVSDMIFVAVKETQALLSYRSAVIDSLAQRARDLEQPLHAETVKTIVRFFRHFGLSEMHFIENTCTLLSQAKVLNTPDSDDGSFLDLRQTGLLNSGRRILLTLTNALAKMDTLLTLFLTESTAAGRSLNLIRRLWESHVRNWQLQNNQPAPIDNTFFINSQYYQKEPVHFSFPDWDPEVDVDEQVALMRFKWEKLHKRFIECTEESVRQSTEKSPESSAMWIAWLIMLLTMLAGATLWSYTVIKTQVKATDF